MSNVQQAREALGLRLRELRREAGLNGKGLAELLAWPPSKVSKIETGKQTPSEADLLAWVRVVGAEDAKDDLLATLRTLELQYAEWRRQLRAGTRARQQVLVDLDAKTTLIRAFESAYVPGLLQTAEYARHRLAEVVELYEIPDDVDEGVRTRMGRQEILYRADKRFHFVVTEAVLRYQVCPPEVMAGQLDRLLALTSLRNVRLGVIPFGIRYPVAPAHGFWIFDDQVAFVETFAAELTLTQPQEIDLYTKVFTRLASVACYGGEARRIVTRVLGDLAESED